MKSWKSLGLTTVILAASIGLFGSVQKASAYERVVYRGRHRVLIETTPVYTYQPGYRWVAPVTSTTPVYDEFGNVIGSQTVLVRAGHWAPVTYWVR